MQEPVTANWIAYIALLIWPMITVLLYRTRPFSEATVWTILGGLLLLPSQLAIKIPMIPAIDKASVSALSATLGCLLLAPRLKRPSAGPGLVEILAILYVVGPVVTAVLNDDLIVIGDRVLPGVGWYDGISSLLGQTILFLPFFVGRRFLRKADDVEIILRVLAMAGLLYSLPMLFEIRFSPQLSNWFYGYFPSSFAGESRYDGFRPVVFLNNGLTVAFFMSTAVLAAIALWRVNGRFTRLPGGVSAYLGAVLVLCKSSGSLVYAIVFGSLIRWVKPVMQVRFAVLLAGIAILYPVLRITEYFPTDQLVNVSSTFSQERAESLKFRFDQEQQLLARASERFFFGWGRYGRNRVYDQESGRDDSITDGLWILILGQFGFVGFLAQFGLLALPVFRANSAIKRIRSSREGIFMAALAAVVALTVIEQLPNSSVTPWSWLLAGALMGRAEKILAARFQANLGNQEDHLSLSSPGTVDVH